MVLEAFWGSLGLVLGALGGLLGGSWELFGASRSTKVGPRLVLELSWASFARVLLPKMALGALWGCLWLGLAAPEGLVRFVLASVKPISIIETALPNLDSLFPLDVVVVVEQLLNL